MENLAYLLLLLLVLIMLLIYVGYDIWCMSRFTYSPKKDKDQPSMWDPPSPIRRILDNWFDAILTKKLLKRLESLDKRDWLWYGHQFNNWAFPIEFYDLIPKWYRRHGRYIGDRRFKIINPVCERIRDAFSLKDELWFNNVVNGRMSESEFEYWFSLRNGNTETSYYHRLFEVKELKWWEDETFEKLKSIGLVNDPPSDEKQTETVENK